MRKTLFLAFTLLLTLGAIVTSSPRAEAALCGWSCHCGNLVCNCATLSQCGKPPALHCPDIACP